MKIFYFSDETFLDMKTNFELSFKILIGNLNL